MSSNLDSDFGPPSGIRVIWVEPEGPRNLGLAARACSNWGVKEWVWVRPKVLADHSDALDFATGHSGEWLKRAQVVSTLSEALQGCSTAVALHGKTTPFRGPAGVKFSALGSLLSSNATVGLILGNERYGLSAADLDQVPWVCRIPTAPAEVESLNVTHALVTALAAERLHRLRGLSEHQENSPQGATLSQWQEVMKQGQEWLAHWGFVHGGNPRRLGLTLQRLLERAAPRDYELNALRALLGRIRRQ